MATLEQDAVPLRATTSVDALVLQGSWTLEVLIVPAMVLTAATLAYIAVKLSR